MNEYQQSMTEPIMLSVDDSLEILTMLCKEHASERLKKKIFNITGIMTPKIVMRDDLEKIQEAFLIVSMAKAYGLGKELCSYLDRLEKLI